MLQESDRLRMACIFLLQGIVSEAKRSCAAVVHILVIDFPGCFRCAR